jgi:y4mF family transcriptional regulator
MRSLFSVKPHVRAGTEETMAATSPLASRVRAQRRALQLDQADLADLAGVSERFVNALENGKRSVQLDKVLAVLTAVGLHLEIHRGADGEIR